jgi:hypothetical protein
MVGGRPGSPRRAMPDGTAVGGPGLVCHRLPDSVGTPGDFQTAKQTHSPAAGSGIELKTMTFGRAHRPPLAAKSAGADRL